jgi:hypothetical protein
MANGPYIRRGPKFSAVISSLEASAVFSLVAKDCLQTELLVRLGRLSRPKL